MNNTLSLKNIIVFIICVLAVIMCVFSVNILLMLFASFVITCAINPIINKLEKYIPRIWCVALVLLGLLACVFLILVPLISVCIKEVAGFVSSLSVTIDNFDKLLNIKIFQKPLADFITFSSLKDALLQGSQSLIENSITAGKWFIDLITALFAIIVMVFYFAYDEKRLKDKFIEFFPVEQKKKAENILDNISSKVGNYVLAQGIAMVFVGALTLVGLLIIHNSHAFLLGVITCVLDIIPVIGPTIAVLIGLTTAISGGFLYVLLTFTIYMIAQWAQNQLLRPIVFGKLLNMHPLMIIVSLLICAKFLGITGIILSPAIACAVCVLVDELYLNRINENKNLENADK